MRRPVVQALVVLALAGCGGKQATPTPPPATAAPTARTLTSASDRAACAELEAKIRDVSQLVSGSIELMTQSLHPKELATRTGEAQHNLLYAASVLDLLKVPRELTSARHRLVEGLRSFANDFGKAKAAVARNDMAAAAKQLADRTALAKVAAATKTIDRACRA